jgi:hypothetical protein
MKGNVNNQGSAICGDIPYDGDRRVLVVGRVRRSYCSQACLRVGMNVLRIARRKALLRRWAVLLLFALGAAGVGYVRLRWMQEGRDLRAAAPAPPPSVPSAPLEETPFGPHWPPTDEEWQADLARATWVHPLPGPTRRRATACARLVAADPTTGPRARCRSTGHCGVDLGGELWGEHVYAARDGVIDRLQRSSEDAPGGVYLRIAHGGGAVFTHYAHLAAVPTRLALGMHVEAGEVIGLLGDTGTRDGRARLHFALSIRPSSALPEVYWDPEPFLATWPRRTAERGSVAGLIAADAPSERVAGTPAVRRSPSLRPR